MKNSRKGSRPFAEAAVEDLLEQPRRQLAARDGDVQLVVQLEDFEKDVNASRRLDLETWRRRSLLSKAREQFWGAFGEIF